MTPKTENNIEIVGLEYPHIANRLKAIWGSRECEDYLTSLIFNLDRPIRRGFPEHIMKALMAIQAALIVESTIKWR